MRYRIQTPVHRFTGVAAGVEFVNGTAVIDDAAQATALAYFRRRHYGVTPEVEGEHGPELVGSAGYPEQTPGAEPGEGTDSDADVPGEHADEADDEPKKTTTRKPRSTK